MLLATVLYPALYSLDEASQVFSHH